jgi:hypothetical protein
MAGFSGLLGLSSAGVCFKVLPVEDYDVRRAPLVRGIAFLDGIHVQELDQDVGSVAGDLVSPKNRRNFVR